MRSAIISGSVCDPCNILSGRPNTSSREYPESLSHPGLTDSTWNGDRGSVITCTMPP